MKVAAGVDEVQRPYRAAFPEGVFPYLLDPRRPVADELDAPDLADPLRLASMFMTDSSSSLEHALAKYHTSPRRTIGRPFRSTWS